MDRSNLKERAADICKMADSLSDELAQLDLPEPSFEKGLAAPLHSDAPDSAAGAARQKLLQMLDEFRALLTEPTLLLTPELVSIFEPTSSTCSHLLMILPAQPANQCPLHCPLGHRGELPAPRNYGSGSSKQAQRPREPNKASARSLRNASCLLRVFS